MRLSGEATGSRLATIELGPFQLPNPGGGSDLLENASMILVPGHRYGLIGRNGKGKSTLLKFIASRRVGGLDPSTSVHYVSQVRGTLGGYGFGGGGGIEVFSDGQTVRGATGGATGGRGEWAIYI